MIIETKKIKNYKQIVCLECIDTRKHGSNDKLKTFGKVEKPESSQKSV